MTKNQLQTIMIVGSFLLGYTAISLFGLTGLLASIVASGTIGYIVEREYNKREQDEHL